MSQGTLSQRLDWFLSFPFYALVLKCCFFCRQLMEGSFLQQFFTDFPETAASD